MLGRLRMTTGDALRTYNVIAESVFCKANQKPSYKDGAFKATTLKKQIQDLVAAKELGEYIMRENNEAGSTKTFVCAIPAASMAHPRLFRSYAVRENPSTNCKIWEAARATTAAPTFFKCMTIVDDGGAQEDFLDGGLSFNNPAQLVLDEAFAIFGGASKLGCLVSIGTGHPGTIGLSQPDAFQKILPTEMVGVLKRIATNCEQIAHELARRFRQSPNRYFRYNVSHGVGNISLEEWKKMNEVQTHTKAYLEEVDVSSSIDKAVEILVRGGEARRSELSLQSICSVVPGSVAGPTSRSPMEHQPLSSHYSPNSSKSPQQQTLSTEERDCLQSLWPSGMDYESQKDQNPPRVPNTCLWTLENPKYISWRDNDTKKLLCIFADPGCGKSVLARCIIDEDLPEAFLNNPSKRIVYYFFKDTSPEQRSVARAMSTILHQMFALQPQLIRYALPSYREIGAALSTTFPKLWSIFTAAVTDPLAGEVTCLFDALDECNEQEQMMLIEALEKFCLRLRTSSSASRLKFLVTSRPYFEIRRGFDKLLEASTNIELAGNDESASIKNEIDNVIKHRVAELAKENRLGKKVSDHLKKRLLETEHRTYLWLWLLWEIIKKDLSGTITEMNELIDNLPSGIQDTYETLLQRCPKPLFARKVLQIVLVAGRPLTLEEIDVALKVNEQTSSYADLELEGPARLEETLSSRCGLMISVIDSKIYFFHQTVKEFLLYRDGTKSPARRTWQQSLDLEESHDLMAEICLRSISFSEIRLDQADLCNALLPENDREMEPNIYCRDYTLLPYSAIYWADHSRYRKNSKDWKIIERFLETSDCRSIKGRWGSNNGNTLHAASYGGHEKIVQILLEKDADVNAEGGKYGTALTAASEGGHEKIVQILLEKDADVNAEGGWYGTALAAASAKGYEKIVQILLEKKADVIARGRKYSTALAAASYEGHEKIVQILLEKDADVNAEAGEYGTALAAASARGHEKIVQILLEKDADVNAEARWYGTALAAASAKGYEKIVQILLEKKADVNARGGKYSTALAAASYGGHEKIVQILLEKDADVNAEDGEYGTALAAASAKGYEKIVQILLEKDADVNAQNGWHSTALAAASYGGHEKIVQILLEKDADVNAQGEGYGTALAAASYGGHEKTVQILLEKDADVNAECGQYGTALATASYGGHEKIVQILLEKDADVNAEGGEYGTALAAASAKGYEKIVQMLLEKKADVNARGGKYSTALAAASYEGHEKIIQILLEKKADVNAQGGEYNTALAAASARGHEKIVQILLEKDADVNAQGGEYGTALAAASARGHEKIVQILLEKDADVNAEGGKYGTALTAASARGHEKIVQILLEKDADVNAQGGEYNTALTAASAKGYEKIVQILLEKDADVNAEGGEYGTALATASAKGYEKIVQILLEKKADVNARGGTALAVASARGHEKIVGAQRAELEDCNEDKGQKGKERLKLTEDRQLK
ncbi:hypothetical protein OEA41_003305 [Lepraria neglecta]|uniref:phospholipase A2 n=1 Tax=Lepraria neglecta TaxID=209136 RepID=A0AAE0DIV7_9LECA|nr:hypothetical protein OEA41_003305 [Lepraria neglecta]